MYTRMSSWQVTFGFSFIAFGSGCFLCLPRAKKDAGDLHYAELRAAINSLGDRLKIHYMAVNGNPEYGFFVTRVGDPRTRDELCYCQATDRKGMVAVIQVLGRSVDDPSVRTRCADCELIGDPELIQELLEHAIALAPPAADIP